MIKTQVFLVVVLAMVAVASAQWHSGGVKDWAGNYYDFTTGQVASSATGKVYNTGVVPLPYAHHAGYANPAGYAHHGGLWW